MEFCILTEDEFRNFSKSCPYESFMQTVELAHLKEELGSKIHYVGVKKDDNIIASSLMLEDTTILGKKMFYAPRGLLVDYHNKELLTFFTKNLKKYIKKQGGFILTIDPNVIYRVRTSDGEIDKNNPSDNESIQNLKDLGYKHYGFNIYLDSRQARWCYRFTLDQDYESKKVKFSKSRYNTYTLFSRYRKNLQRSITSCICHRNPIITGPIGDSSLFSLFSFYKYRQVYTNK